MQGRKSALIAGSALITLGFLSGGYIRGIDSYLSSRGIEGINSRIRTLDLKASRLERDIGRLQEDIPYSRPNELALARSDSLAKKNRELSEVKTEKKNISGEKTEISRKSFYWFMSD